MSTASVVAPASLVKTRKAKAPDPTVTDPALVRRAVKAAALGNAMEWFEVVGRRYADHFEPEQFM